MNCYTWNTAEHRLLMRKYRSELLDFYQTRVVNPSGGFWWLGSDGIPLPEKGIQLWLSARMIHCFSLAHLDGRPGAFEVAQQGVDFYYSGAGRDRDCGGWHEIVKDGVGSGKKNLYGLAHVILASASASVAGINNAESLLSEALELLESKYWESEWGLALDTYDASFSHVDAYRGLNANMHLTEALLAAYEATGKKRLFDMAVGIASFLVRKPVLSGRYRLVEHYDEQWKPTPNFNRDYPDHPFKPYGSTPGHWLEWAKLIMQIFAIDRSQDWAVAAAKDLFEGAYRDAWLPGFAYTVDWDGAPMVSYRFWWPVTEAMGAAHLLAQHTDNSRYKDAYRELWQFADSYLIDHQNSGWFYELDDGLKPISRTWQGKPDLYHIYQAALYCELPFGVGLAKALSERS
ncbi:AGE family epimerase/isomerase [Trueperella pyogenes]|uniref:AGE family epimerase/isomerase n=1 Tax=Trueperella pyogenes TaxID=1661 RepID=UPI0024BF22C2|nr:AGE family epimerase/isomerase [Trueperella pyogenes]WHU58771.1 AGE family epimerase/isomerase [Trueperella pyogenes]